ncbi:signal peptidase II [Candidatus Woesearchaeota archaeon]|nr:signal peptidase II [Candidatus Woesearchaeota archaeon]
MVDFLTKHKWESFFFIVTLGIVAIDQLLKYLILTFTPVIHLNLLTIHLIRNTGAGFGILKNQALLLTAISFIVALLILFNYRKIAQELFPQAFFALFMGGIIGNLIDRALRRFVIDFIDFKFWPAFNLADACITLSVIGLIIWYWRK